ncbi:lipopolysaccharide biosynthesis protein [Actinomadura sp. KC345]|uniref:lipopolysaccharide biosynthesis protein n=1 Tax=Actinomadura sp. KC345 TaxID=2530371 RepID=UPI00104D7366|nr:lipopolysaccharide biosynthesis protein [Actinomadura sp. KC345]TDC45777.1 lipopolysaccharide biosynthesis protein [Actinomadura sp. KC345]
MRQVRPPGPRLRRRPRRAVAVAAGRARGRGGALLRRYALPIAFVLAGFLGGLGYALLAPTTYTAAAFVLVVDEGQGGRTGPAAVNFAQAYGRLAPLPETLDYSTRPLPEAAPGSTREHIQASTSPDTPLIRLAGTARTAKDAAAFANAAADALVRYGASHRSDTGVRVAMMTVAAPPETPSSPNLPLGVAVGTASGVLLAGLSAAVAGGRRGRGTASRRPDAAVPGPARAGTAATTGTESAGVGR